MSRLKRNDMVKVLSGKDRGKTGKILAVFPKKERALVEGVNFVKRHTRQTRQDTKGGIIQKESPIRLSNLMMVCKHCNKPAKVGFRLMKDGSSRARVCKKCGEVIA